MLNTELEYVNSFGCYGDGDCQFNRPNDIAQDRVGNLYVTDTSNNRVQVFDYKGWFLSTFSKKGAASQQLNQRGVHYQKLSNPRGICIGSDQFIYISDNGNNCVSVFKTSGEFVTSFGNFSDPRGIVIDDDGFVYVCDHELGGEVYIM